MGAVRLGARSLVRVGGGALLAMWGELDRMGVLTMSENTIPEGGAIPLVHPWCPPERPYPESYQAALERDPARCVAEDPCSDDGVSTLWHVDACPVPATSSTVATTEVVTSEAGGGEVWLPETGGTVGPAGVGLVCVLVGVALVRRGRRGVAL